MDIQSANRQHPVPQNVMEVEFKLIGDLTIRQFTYLLLFGILAMMTGYSNLPNIFKIPLIGIFVIAGISFAFIPLNDISLDKWTVNYIKAILRPRFRIWMHTKNTPYFLTYVPVYSAQQNVSHAMGTLNKQKLSLDELLNSDKPKSLNFKDESDIESKEKEFYKRLGLKTEIVTNNPQPILNVTQPLPKIEIKTNSQNANINNFVIPNQNKNAELKLKKEDIQEEHELKHNLSSIAISKNLSPVVNENTKPIIIQVPTEQPENKTPIEQVENKEAVMEELKPVLTPNLQQAPEEITSVKVEPAVTPEEKDKYEQEIINYQKHIKELNLLKQKLLKELEQNKYKVLEGKEEEVAKITVKERTASLQQENKELKEKLKKISEQKVINSEKANIEKSPFFASFLLKIKGEKETENIEGAKEDISNGEFVGNINAPEDAETLRNKIKVKGPNKKTFKLKGNTQDTENNLIPEVVIIVKNSVGEAVRALKSNTVGEFESSTELAVDDYIIEASKEGYTFEILNLKASDNDKGLVKLIGIKQ